MMKLNLMKRFFDSVDDEWRSPIADEIGLKWFAESFDATCIRASANFVFQVKTGEQNYLLRFNHASERDAEFITAELTYIEHLVAGGIRVNKPLRSLAGNLVESVTTPMGVFHSVLFEFLPDEHLELDDFDANATKRWGQALGEMHRASEGFRVDGRLDWLAQLEMIRQIVPRSDAIIWKETDAVEKKLRALPMSDTNYGLIHYDFEPDNLVWSGSEIGIFDLDDCMYAWFAMDISNAISSELFDDQVENFDFMNPKLQWFLEGYRSVRPMDDEEISQMPLFLRLDNLIAFARIYRSVAEGPVEHEPEWAANLRQKLSMKLDKFRDSFQDHPISEAI